MKIKEMKKTEKIEKLHKTFFKKLKIKKKLLYYINEMHRMFTKKIQNNKT